MEDALSADIQGVGGSSGEPVGGFYRLLYEAVTTDPVVIRFREEMDRRRQRIKELKARHEAKVKLMEEDIRIIGIQEKNRVSLITTRFLKKRRKELAVDHIMPDKINGA